MGLVCGIHVEGHDLQGESLFVVVLHFVAVGLAEDRTERAFVPFFVVGVSPVIAGLGVRVLQLFFVLGIVEALYEVIVVAECEVSVLHTNGDEAGELHFKGATQVDKVTECFREGVVSRTDGLLAEVACMRDGCRIAEGHREAFLVDGVLALGLGEFFLARISKECVLQLLVGNEAGPKLTNSLPDLMDVLAVEALILQFLGNVEVAQLGWLDQLGPDLIGEGTHVAEIDTLHNLIHTLPLSICSLRYSPVALKMIVNCALGSSGL